MRAHARTHTHACARAHPHTQTHLEIERERRARARAITPPIRAQRSRHIPHPLSLSISPSRRPALARSARHVVAPARARGVWDGADSKLAAGLAQRWSRETTRREPGRADAARRCRRGCASWCPAATLWRLMRVTSARSGRGVHGLRAAARTQARLCSCGRRDVVWTSLANASRRGLSRRLAAVAARAQTHGPQRHAHSAHADVLPT